MDYNDNDHQTLNQEKVEKKSRKSTIQRSPHNKEIPYAQINRASIQNNKLSWQATGMLAYLISQSNGWVIYKDEICKHKTNGRDSGRKAFDELIKNKYLLAIQLYKNNLKNRVMYFLCEIPYEDGEEELKKFLRDSENQDAVIKKADNPTLIKIKEIKIKEIKIKRERDKPSASSSISKEKLIERDKNISTTESEHQDLAKEYGEAVRDRCYEIFSEWKSQTPRTRWKKGDYLSIKRWVVRAYYEEKENKKKLKKFGLSEDNASLAKRIAANFNPIVAKEKDIRIDVTSSSMQFVFLRSQKIPINIPLNSGGFKDQVENTMYKLKLM